MIITGRTVLFGMLAFFGVIFAVNGVFLYAALDTFPGLTSGKAYVEGLEYNRTLADGERQAALGWKTETGISTTSAGDEVRVRIFDGDGQLVPYLNVTAEIVRPATASGARKVGLIASMDGHVATVETLAPGRWLVRIVAERDGAQVYRVDDEIYIKP
jgi:nitrogen fixation protein FixH